ncbi:hypothetical protein UFOVP1307_46 [uncultured Caudovirales phage]|uniref:Uncharacterized protein n=1 Tax=uncultured Caudovirales phage TaxID=2100421 RepID=A0A6J5PNR1_9CAUD|nr:hypothetical protein UFOVP651_77 [uncultured Caudovirales phage]CAB4170971.1 hypothetical protein UFOVP902_156 [uncultured Caudovirales phage]CAB4198054.1 hypothetical protein UFOVP1307_46 [uncultured Caudovirales phage]
MKTYVYYYKSDSTNEIIGRVMATSLDEAREFIKQVKQLSIQDVDNLFEIKELPYEQSN